VNSTLLNIQALTAKTSNTVSSTPWKWDLHDHSGQILY